MIQTWALEVGDPGGNLVLLLSGWVTLGRLLNPCSSVSSVKMGYDDDGIFYTYVLRWLGP